MRQPVDFTEIRPEHREIDARLAEWARWCWSGEAPEISPMFRLYRSAEHWGHEKPVDVDVKAAEAVQEAFSGLPEINRWAIRWAYGVINRRLASPSRMAREFGVSLAGLSDEIHRGRTMVKNRLRHIEYQNNLTHCQNV